MHPESLIAFPASTGLPYSVTAAWSIHYPDRPKLLFCVQHEEASCIDIYDPISGFHIALVQGDKQQCEDWVNRHYQLAATQPFKLETDGKASTFTNQSARRIVIWMRVPDEDQASAVFGLLAHEAVHAAYAVMDGMGMKPDFANEEFTAYFVQFILNNYTGCIGLPVPEKVSGD